MNNVAGYLQWVEIDSNALSHNVRIFRKLAGPKRKLLAVVKANAYGHGLLEVARLIRKNGIDWFGVNTLEEGISLRQAAITEPIIVLGYVPLNCLEEAVSGDLRLTVFNYETVEVLNRIAAKLKKKVYIHIKVETGTNRLGVLVSDLVPFARSLKKNTCFVIEGLSSHFANIEDTTSHDYPRRQLELYRAAMKKLDRLGINVKFRHMSCTASCLLFREPELNLARVGIGLYGLWPSKETLVSWLITRKKPVSLRPVLTWKARVAQVKRIPSGSYVGYGCTYQTTRPTTLAVVPVGYFDGYDRGLSNVAHVLIRGKRAPVRGRVAMNFIMVDVTDISGVTVEDEVILIGSSGHEKISADDLAALAGTINYEIVSRIGCHVPRVVI